MSNLIREAIEKKGNALGTFLGVSNAAVQMQQILSAAGEYTEACI